MTTVDAPAIRRMWRARPDCAATPTVVTLCDEIERLTIELDRAERGLTYWQRRATETDTDTYRALVERTAERDRLQARLRHHHISNHVKGATCACVEVAR